MFDEWQEVYRCKECGRVYKIVDLPHICSKCGATLTGEYSMMETLMNGIMQLEHDPRFKITGSCEKTVARRPLFKWKFRENVGTNNDEIYSTIDGDAEND